MTIDYAQRLTWLRHRLALGIDESDLDVGRHPAFSGVRDLTAAVMILPADPLAPLIGFRGEAPGVIPRQLEGRIGKHSCSNLHYPTFSGGYALRVSRDTEDKTPSVLAGVARHGGAVAGMGAINRVSLGDAVGDKPVREYRLDAITALVRVALQTQMRVNRLPEAGSFRE